MTGHPQSSPRGYWQKEKIGVGASALTASATALDISLGVKISSLQEITGLSTGLVWAANSTVGSMPANKTTGVNIGFMTNSTGTAAFINLSGTTHKYLSVTTKQPS